ncbi:serine-rich adhesin for platelets [Drosophila tropicalis]|uniref:serine-rich adhesin for platelets n=1 Tax=Drosophila tropicalis TaxID=46794 RepID=UPI0035AC14EE
MNNELNLRIVRAVGKQPLLYDRNDENYRKRLPTENCWDLVAAETGDSVEKCKRRWRQLRNDYARWLSNDIQRRQSGKRRLPFLFANDLKFLLPHMDVNDEILEDTDDSKSESTSGGRENEMNNSSDLSSPGSVIEAAAPIKEGSKSSPKSVEGEKLAKKGGNKEEDKEEQAIEKSAGNRNKKVNGELIEAVNNKDTSDEEELDELRMEASPILTSGTSPENSTSANKSPQTEEFFIKQSDSDNLLIISKKPSTSVASTSDYLGDTTMTEDSADETMSLPRGTRRRVGRPRNDGIKQLPIQKATGDQRLTRLQRRKSILAGAEHMLRSSTSPVKMTTVPRSLVNQSKTQNDQAPKSIETTTPGSTPTSTPTSVTSSQSAQSEKVSVKSSTTSSLNNSIEGIYPRRPHFGGVPKIKAPPSLSSTSSESSLIFPRRDIVTKKAVLSLTPKSATITTTTATATSSGGGITAKRSTAGPVYTQSQLKSNVSTSSLSDVPSPQPVRLPSVVISSTPTSSSSLTATSFNPAQATSTSFVMQTNPATISTVSGSNNNSGLVGGTVSTMSTPILTYVKRCERGVQTKCPDVFSDQYFLDMVQPQMEQMNARQKFRFKQKVFAAIMETFDDATDFPANGEVQHFNINTPSGLEDITDPELRLLRELVSMVSAAKRTESMTNTIMNTKCNAADTSTGSLEPTPARPGHRMTDSNLQRHIIQQVQKQVNAQVTSPGQEKRVYRILPMNGRKDAPMPVSRVITGPNPKTTSSSIVTARTPQDSSLNALFGPLKASTIATASQQRAAGVASLQIRQMSRRFSVCGVSGSGGIQGTQTSTQAAHNNQNNPELAKRRMLPSSDNSTPPQQRPRLSTVQGDASAASLLRKSNNTVPAGPKQTSPSGVLAALQHQQQQQHRTPQIASVQGGATPFNDFIQPSAVKSSPQANKFRRSQSPVKRTSLVVANVKNVAAKPTGGAGGISSGPQSINSKAPVATPTVNMANLLGGSGSNSPPPSNNNQSSNGDIDMAATIAADDFSLAGLKREPRDPLDEHDDILGM